jgi:hypothetical protein
MGRCHGKAVAMGNKATFFSEARRHQELFDREVRKLYHRGTVKVVVDEGKQCRARGQHCFQRIFQASILAKFWDRSCLEIKCEKFSQFLNSERMGHHGDTLKEPSSKFPVGIMDFSQGAFICFVK